MSVTLFAALRPSTELATPTASAQQSWLTAYLRVLGLEPRPPTLDFLRTLTRAHIMRIPFENITSILRRASAGDADVAPLDRQAELHSWSARQGGGVCFEVVDMVGALLDGLGFRQHPVLATISFFGSHQANLVTVDGAQYLVDAGNGAPFFDPVPILPDGAPVEVHHVGLSYRFRPETDGAAIPVHSTEAQASSPVEASSAGDHAQMAGAEAGRAGAEASRAGASASRAGASASRAGVEAGRAGASASRAGAKAGRAGAKASSAEDRPQKLIQERRIDGEWRPFCTYALSPATEAGRVEAYRRHHTRGQSWVVDNLTLIRCTDTDVSSLRDNRVTHYTADGKQTFELSSRAEFERIIAETFGLPSAPIGEALEALSH
ncbi:MAG: arylamine N-acetyltransferase [Chloroflexi bacterium]|nr:arylamine N-acetyltransferase [Chloroflexota bacterium]